MEPFWLVLALALAGASMGAKGLISLIIALIIFLLGALLIILGVSFARHNSTAQHFIRNVARQSWSWFRSPFVSNEKLKRNESHAQERRMIWESASLTGSSAIDEPLNLILSYIYRDYIYPWHFKLTHDRAFPIHLKDSINYLVVNLSLRIKAVDWMPYLTTRLVDDVASHVRLFKKARFALQIRRSKTSEDNGKLVDLESLFFDSEVGMETNLCRDLASSIQQEELNYLQSVAEILLFLLLKEQDFNATPFRGLAREIIVNSVLKPTLDLVSDPDFINQTLVWLYQDYKIKNDIFLTSIRYSENMEELLATREMVQKEVSFIRSNDSKGELDSSLKSQLNSLLYLVKVIDNRIKRLKSGAIDVDTVGIPASEDWNQRIGPGMKLFDLPIDVILKNNIALSFFIDYMTSIGCQSYLFFYLNIEGWKVSAESQLQALELDDLHLKNDEEKNSEKAKKAAAQKLALTENMRDAAHSIYEEYLSEKASPRLKIDESVVKRLLFKIRSEPPASEWFDESQVAIYAKLQEDERFLVSFKRSVGYVRLLRELDLLRDVIKSEEDEDDDDSNSLSGEELSIYDSNSVQSSDSIDSGLPKSHKRTGSSVSNGSGFFRNSPPSVAEPTRGQSEFTAQISAQITEFHIMKENVVKPFAMYTIVVTMVNHIGYEEEHQILRRYSDFYALHQKIIEKYPKLERIAFPSKKTFGNMNESVLEKRRTMLNEFLKELLKPETLQANTELIIYMTRFLDHTTSYQSERQSNVLKSATTSVKNSVKTAAHAVTSVPGNIIHYTVDNVTNLSKALTVILSAFLSVFLLMVLCFQSGHGARGSNSHLADGKVGASLETEPGDNIPLRIILLLMDEVFDLQERNQWLRRQIVAVLRQLIKAMFGDIVNRRIVDYFAQMTSPERIGSYIESLKQSLWPDG